MPVYLIHFDKKFHHAQHYIGFAEEYIEARFVRHKAGNGSRLLRAVVAAGINIRIARIWSEGDRNFERGLKNSKNSKRYCPICNGGKTIK